MVVVCQMRKKTSTVFRTVKAFETWKEQHEAKMLSDPVICFGRIIVNHYCVKERKIKS